MAKTTTEMTDKIKRSLDFVVRYYRPDAFRPDGRFIETPLPFWRRHAVAASIIGAALVAAAAVTTYIVLDQRTPAAATTIPAPTPDSPTVEIHATPATATVEFDNASLAEVVAAIESTYGVKVSGMTDNRTRLTLSYQGTAEDLVETINDLLGTNLKVEK